MHFKNKTNKTRTTQETAIRVITTPFFNLEVSISKTLLTSSHLFWRRFRTHFNFSLSDVSKSLQSACFNFSPDAGAFSVHFEEKAKLITII